MNEAAPKRPGVRRRLAWLVLAGVAALVIWQLQRSQPADVRLVVPLTDLELRTPAPEGGRGEALTRDKLTALSLELAAPDGRRALDASWNFPGGAPPVVSTADLPLARGSYELIAHLRFRRHDGTPITLPRRIMLEVERDGPLHVPLSPR